MNSIKRFVKQCISFGDKIRDDNVSAFAAQTTLFIILSFFPFVMFLLTLLQYLPFTQDQLMEVISRFMPPQVSTFIESLVDELYSDAAGTILSITIIVSLWTAAKGILAIYNGLNSVYHIAETRNYVILRARATIYTLIFALMLIFFLAVFVFGNQIVNWITHHVPILMDYKITLTFISLKSVIGFVVLFIVFLLMYKFIPNRKTRLFREIPGAIVGSIGWLGFSYLYSFYIDNMNNMTATYGSLTAIVLCILWLYACMSIFFFGAELNSVLVPFLQVFEEQLARRRKKRRQQTTKDYTS